MTGGEWYRQHLHSLTDCELYEATKRILKVELIESRELPATHDVWSEWQARQRVDLWALALAEAKREIAEHAESNRRALEELRARCAKKT